MYADKHRIARSFEVGDFVYLRLQPYRQSSLKKERSIEVKTPLLWTLQNNSEGGKGGI